MLTSEWTTTIPAVHTQLTPHRRPVVFLVGSNRVFNIKPSSATIYATARMNTASQPLRHRTFSSRIISAPGPYSSKLASNTKGFKYGEEPRTYSAVSGAKKNRNQAGDILFMAGTPLSRLQRVARQCEFCRFHCITASNFGDEVSSAPSSNPQLPHLLLVPTEEKMHIRPPPRSCQASRYFV